MIIKVCGMCHADNIRDVTALGIDWMGMIFWPRSPRHVAMIPTGAGIIPDRAATAADCDTVALAPAGDATKHVKRVGVFVDDSPQNIITHVVNYRLDLIQLHGNETLTLLRNLRATLDPDIRPDIKFIKAISIGSADDLTRCADYADCADYLLFDTRCATVGGSGRRFDWSVLDRYEGPLPFLLSGGIGPDDAAEIKKISHPMFAGIDLNSRFETAPGMKNVEALKKFIAELTR